MGQISRQLAARFRDSGKYRKAIREHAKQIRESDQIPTDVNGIEQLVKQGFDPLHAAYVSIQNFTAFFAETVSAFDEFDPYSKVIGADLEEYVPEGPPISPLTASYFTTTAFFDFRFGSDLETIGTCLIDVSGDIGMDEGMLELTRRFQNTRMGIYENTGIKAGKVQLRELLTDEVFKCHATSGYTGKEGELWYVRLCPPIVGLLDYHVVFTTPYVLVNASEADWVAYLHKNIMGAADSRQALYKFLKYGATWNRWNEFVFQAYHHHQPDAIFLAGLPNVKGSLPHASNRPT